MRGASTNNLTIVSSVEGGFCKYLPPTEQTRKRGHMSNEEWNQVIEAVKYQNAYFANFHIDKQIEVIEDPESWGEVELLPDPNRKGHLTWIPF